MKRRSVIYYMRTYDLQVEIAYPKLICRKILASIDIPSFLFTSVLLLPLLPCEALSCFCVSSTSTQEFVLLICQDGVSKFPAIRMSVGVNFLVPAERALSPSPLPSYRNYGRASLHWCSLSILSSEEDG